jgi:membrane-bound serine protease (ClpP class)
MSGIIGFFLLALVLASFEILVPGGILGFFAVIALGASAYFAYEPFGLLGSVLAFFVGGTLVLVAVAIEFRLVGKTRFRNRMVLGAAVEGRTESLHSTEEILGKEGTTLTTLAPSGMVVVDGEKYEAFSRSGLLSRDQRVRVVERDNFRLIVEKL